MDNITLVDGSVMVNSDNNATHSVMVSSDNNATPRDNYTQCGEELSDQEWEIVSQYR